MAEPTRRGMIPVKVQSSMAPDGRLMVLLQLPDGFVLMPPEEAWEVAKLLIEVGLAIRLTQPPPASTTD